MQRKPRLVAGLLTLLLLTLAGCSRGHFIPGGPITDLSGLSVDLASDIGAADARYSGFHLSFADERYGGTPVDAFSHHSSQSS